MKTPKFFYKKSPLSLFLIPLSWLFILSVKVRNIFIKPFKLKDKFVICIGNATVGGGGKTPSVIFIAKALKSKNISVCVISKGYGRSSTGFQRVLELSDVNEVGDEVKIISKIVPVYVYSNYKDILNNQDQIKETVIIMDDGLQNPSMQKDFSILVIDNDVNLKNDLILPAGPFRETFKSAFSKVDAIFNIENISKKELQTEVKQYNLLKTYSLENIQQYGDYLAFCGLAVNEKFFSALKALGINVIQKIEFGDHHKYSRDDIRKILSIAKEKSLIPITTEKDFIKIKNFDIVDNNICILKMSLSFKDDAFINDILKKIIKY
jgi:tetraacyldisaccharide 4'-kinase